MAIQILSRSARPLCVVLLASFLVGGARALCEPQYRFRKPNAETVQWEAYWVPLMIILGGCCALAWSILFIAYNVEQRGGKVLPQLPSVEDDQLVDVREGRPKGMNETTNLLETKGSKEWLEKQLEVKGSRQGIGNQPDQRETRQGIGSQLDRRGSQEGIGSQLEGKGSQEGIGNQLEGRRFHDAIGNQLDRRGSQEGIGNQLDRRGSQERIKNQLDIRGSQEGIGNQLDRRGSQEAIGNQRNRRGSNERIENHLETTGSRERLQSLLERTGFREGIGYPFLQGENEGLSSRPGEAEHQHCGKILSILEKELERFQQLLRFFRFSEGQEFEAPTREETAPPPATPAEETLQPPPVQETPPAPAEQTSATPSPAEDENCPTVHLIFCEVPTNESPARGRRRRGGSKGRK